MLCYRDMTYCTHTECKDRWCKYKITDKVIKEATKFGLPLSLSDFSEVCKQYKK